MVVPRSEKVHLKWNREGTEPLEGVVVQGPFGRDGAFARLQVRKDVEGAAQVFRDETDSMGVAELQNGDSEVHEVFGVERALFPETGDHCRVVRH